MTRPLKWPWSKALKVYLPKSDPASRLSKQGPAERDMSHSPQRVGVLTSHLFASSCRSFKSPTLPFIFHEGILSSPHLSGNKCLLSALPPFGSAIRDVIVLWKATHRRHASDNLIGCGKYLPVCNYSRAKCPQSNSLLGKQKGNKWAVCIWQRLKEATDGRSERWHVPVEKVTEVFSGHLAVICMWQLGPGFP